MGDFLQPWHILVLLFVAGLLMVPAIFYILTLVRVLNKCASASRTIEPAMMWFYFVPLFNLVFHFFIVVNIAKSLSNEFKRRGMSIAEDAPGRTIGFVACICGVCKIIPHLNVFFYMLYFVPWIIYWLKIAGYSRMLDRAPETDILAGAP